MTTRWGLDRGTIIAGALNVLAYVAAALAGLLDWGWVFWIIVAVGALATLTVIFLASRGVRTERQTALRSAQQERRMLEEMFVPIMELIGEVAVAPTARRRELKDHLKHSVITSARHIGPEHTRACFLEVTGAAGVRRLSCAPGMWVGRQEAPRTVFIEGTPRGNRLLEHMDKREPLFVSNLTLEAAQFQPDSQTYRTFVAVSVSPTANHNDPFGVLTIDSPNPGDLSEHDIKIMQILGQLLGSALAMGR